MSHPPGFVFTLAAWAGVAGSVAYLLNAWIGERIERKYTQLVGAILFAGWYGVLLCGQVFLATASLGWIMLITIPGR